MRQTVIQTQPSATQRLGLFCTSLRIQDLPADTVERTKQLLLDQLGCQLAFSALPSSLQAVSYVHTRSGRQGGATLVGLGGSAAAEDAAFVNAVSGHGFEYDDTEMTTASHPGVVVIPTALAFAEERAASGPEVISAIAAGYDVMVRVALAAPGMMKRGFHTTAAAGPFGAAATAGKLLGLDASQLANALGIAASQAAGITEYASSGGSVKRFHPGFAASAGARAAALAAAGVDAPRTALEGPRGYIAAYSGSSRPDQLSENLGSQFMLNQTGIKPYSCCAAQHTAIDATTILMQRDGLIADDVESVEVHLRDRERLVVGNIVHPANEIEAQFSAAYGVACRIRTGGNGYAAYNRPTIADERILALAQRISFPVTPESALPRGDAPARVVVLRRDGTRIEATVEYATGSTERPAGWPQIEAKFRELASVRLPGSRINEVISRVHEFDAAREVVSLMRSLAHPRR